FAMLAVGPLAAMRQSGVDGHAMKPGRQVGIATESIKLADHLQEDILGDIFRVGVVAEHAPRQVVNARRMVPKDLLRRRRRARLVLGAIARFVLLVHGAHLEREPYRWLILRGGAMAFH